MQWSFLKYTFLCFYWCLVVSCSLIHAPSLHACVLEGAQFISSFVACWSDSSQWISISIFIGNAHPSFIWLLIIECKFALKCLSVQVLFILLAWNHLSLFYGLLGFSSEQCWPLRFCLVNNCLYTHLLENRCSQTLGS